MKHYFLLLAFIVIASSVTFGQTKDFYVGPAGSFHHEIRGKMLFNSASDKSSYSSQFFGAGVRVQKKFKETWGVNFGLNYVKRQYDMLVPYNHCYFLPEGELCTRILSYVEKHGYNTIELPLGINKYLVSREKWELYINANVVTALHFRSFYNPYFSEEEKLTINEFNVFSGSLTSSLGFGYHITDRIKLTAEPYVRALHTQRRDYAMHEINRSTAFDNFGGHLLLLFRL